MTLGLKSQPRITPVSSEKIGKKKMLGEMGAEERFQPEPQHYGHVVKLVLWHSSEFTLEGTRVKFLRAMFVILYIYTWRSKLILNLYILILL